VTADRPGVAVLWKRLDRPGHESALLQPGTDGWELSGSAVFEEEGDPCVLTYRISCDAAWETREFAVSGRIGPRGVDVEGRVRAPHDWTLNGSTVPDVAGCIDVDLNFSPSTNLLPIRRLALPVGREATVRAAWLRFPSLRMEPLEQTYRRLAADRYLYRSAGGRFEAEIAVDEHGFPRRYGDFWEIVGR
jgi:hypothetical protein